MERNNVPFDGCGCGCEGVVSSDRDSSADAKRVQRRGLLKACTILQKELCKAESKGLTALCAEIVVQGFGTMFRTCAPSQMLRGSKGGTLKACVLFFLNGGDSL